MEFPLHADATAGEPEFFVWPEADTSYMKLIWKYPSPKYPSGFHVLASRYHPIGDFDRPDIRLPDEPLRVYKTRNGFRVFFTGRHNPDLNTMFDELDFLGGDALYSKYARIRRYYAARIGPKEMPCPYPWAVCRLVGQTGKPLPEWERLIRFHDEKTNALAPGTFLV